MARARYHVLVMTSSKGVRKADFIATREALRPGSVASGLDNIVNEWYIHMGFGTMYNGLTKLVVRGIRWDGVGVDGTDIVWMWNTKTKVAAVVKVVMA
jgi:hypothetical protein